MFWGRFFGGHGGHGAEIENLDRPFSNFDVAGIPVDRWESSFFALHSNPIPSCVLAVCCPCVLWAQVVVRSQIPLLIAIKNSMRCLQNQSGYGFFIDYFAWSVILFVGLVLILGTLYSVLPSIVRTLLVIVAIAVVIAFYYIMGHTRTAFKAKYNLPSFLPADCGSFSCIADAVIISPFCLPCSLAQMARHVFQYDRWQPKLGLWLRDPSILAPLEAQLDRPYLADEAGLAWSDNRRAANSPPNTGRAHRQQELDEQYIREHYAAEVAQQTPNSQQQSVQQRQPTAIIAQYMSPWSTTNSSGQRGAVPATAAITSTSPVYRSDGTLIK